MLAIILAVIFGIVMMFLALRQKQNVHDSALLMSLVLAGSVGYMMVTGNDVHIHGFYDFFELNHQRLFIMLILSISFSVYIGLFGQKVSNIGRHDGELFALLFFIMAGIFMLVLFKNLLTLFLGLEIVSIPLYILAGSDKESTKSNEAALKYFLMGAFTTGILLLGIAFLYGATGSFDLNVTKVYFSDTIGSTMSIVGIMLILISLAFKTSLVPFHFWTPDVYDGSPTAITAFMASIVKVTFVFVLYIFMTSVSGAMYWKWQMIIAILAAATLILGNITAVYQQSAKRMLAYSGIAQAGYMILPILLLDANSLSILVLYFISYIAANLGIFTVLIHLKDYTYDGFIGLAKKHTRLAIMASIFLLSMAGLPISGGFFAKLFSIMQVLNHSEFIWLAVIALVMAAVGIYYYMKPIWAMFFRNSKEASIEKIPAPSMAVLSLLAILILVLGIFPELFTPFIY